MRLEPLDPLSSFLFIEGGSIYIKNILKLEESKERRKKGISKSSNRGKKKKLVKNVYIYIYSLNFD